MPPCRLEWRYTAVSPRSTSSVSRLSSRQRRQTSSTKTTNGSMSVLLSWLSLSLWGMHFISWFFCEALWASSLFYQACCFCCYPEMTYNVFSGTLNPTHSLTQSHNSFFTFSHPKATNTGVRKNLQLFNNIAISQKNLRCTYACIYYVALTGIELFPFQ